VTFRAGERKRKQILLLSTQGFLKAGFLFFAVLLPSSECTSAKAITYPHLKEGQM
jgi:hypothetical protein